MGYLKVYTHDVQQLLQQHSRYPTASLIDYAASFKIRYLKFTEQDYEDYKKELGSMKELESKLKRMLDASCLTIKTLSDKQMSLCKELADKVPNIQGMPKYAEFTGDQQSIIDMSLEEKREEEVVATYGAPAEILKALVANYTPLALSQILQVPLHLVKELKKNLPTTSDNPREHALLLENLTPTMDPREPNQIIEDILSMLEGISPQIEDHRERARCCRELIRSVKYFIEILEPRLRNLEKEKNEKKIKEEKIVKDIQRLVKTEKSRSMALRDVSNTVKKALGNNTSIQHFEKCLDQSCSLVISSTGKRSFRINAKNPIIHELGKRGDANLNDKTLRESIEMLYQVATLKK